MAPGSDAEGRKLGATFWRVHRIGKKKMTAKEKKLRSVRLCLVTDPHLTLGRPIESIVEQALRAGVQMVQLRDKETPSGLLVDLGMKLKKLCRRYRALFIVNDRIDLAKYLEAEGAHLGQEDLPLGFARKILGRGAIIGGSANSVASAKKAQQAGADYLGVGTIFPTETKVIEKVTGVELLREVRKAVKLPLLAIGGVKPENCRVCIEAGADGVAVVSGIMSAPDVSAAAKAYLAEIARVH